MVDEEANDVYFIENHIIVQIFFFLKCRKKCQILVFTLIYLYIADVFLKAMTHAIKPC